MDHVSQFYYVGDIHHLTQGQANNVCSNANNKAPLPYSSTVLVYAKDKEANKFYGQVGLVVGVSERAPQDIWPDWNYTDRTVYEVVWVTGLKVVPSDYFVNQKMALPQADCQSVVQYILEAGR